MEPLRFIVIGSGWRSLFFARIARAYPQYFRMEALLCRTVEKAERLNREYGIHTTLSMEECENLKPDFVVVAVDRPSVFSVTKQWVEKGFPVLCETPAANTLEDLKEIWKLSRKGAKIQVAEQYFRYASYGAAIETANRGYLGEPYSVNISALHEYHAASVIRRILNAGFTNMKVTGKKYTYPVVETAYRGTIIEDGRIADKDRVRVTFEFEDGKTAFYDFDGTQYHSKIRSRHLAIQGARGELDDTTVRYVGEDNKAREEKLTQIPFGTGKAVLEVRLGDEVLYKNPFAELGVENGMPQDETAIATLMLGMKRYIEEGAEAYPLAESLQDAYVTILMQEAVKTGQTVESTTQVWAEV